MSALDIGAFVSVAMLAAVWLLYPLVMGVLARVARHRARRSGRPADTGIRSISVVIATRDEPDAVWGRVEDCLKARNVPAQLEVIVALDPRRGLDPRERGLSARDGVRFVTGDQPGGKAATLNAGVRAAAGDVIVFTPPGERDRFVKRVVGVPGDELELRGNKLFVNGEPADYERLDPGAYRAGNAGSVSARRRCTPRWGSRARSTRSGGPYGGRCLRACCWTICTPRCRSCCGGTAWGSSTRRVRGRPASPGRPRSTAARRVP